MKRSTFVIFAVFALGLGVGIPLWASNSAGKGEGGRGDVAETVRSGVDDFDDVERSFVNSCGSCHTLEAAGADGIVGPNLDDLLAGGSVEANRTRVLGAVLDGIAGRMPAAILRGEEADDVSTYVAVVAGQ